MIRSCAIPFMLLTLWWVRTSVSDTGKKGDAAMLADFAESRGYTLDVIEKERVSGKSDQQQLYPGSTLPGRG